jgi:hypothetical protein
MYTRNVFFGVPHRHVISRRRTGPGRLLLVYNPFVCCIYSIIRVYCIVSSIHPAILPTYCSHPRGIMVGSWFGWWFRVFQIILILFRAVPSVCCLLCSIVRAMPAIVHRMNRMYPSIHSESRVLAVFLLCKVQLKAYLV